MDELKKQYKNYISLGYFCSVAMELEKYGLRDYSYPFDWIISDFEGIVSAINDNFSDYLDYDNLYQSKKVRSTYLDQKYQFVFIHDFDKYKCLDSQLDFVREKHRRRIERFYEKITEPTLFIRYISDEASDENGKSKELLYIEENIDDILGTFKRYNPENDIIWIANQGVISDVIKIYHVVRDENDTCCRKPFDNSTELHQYFETVEYPMRKDNLLRYQRKQKKKNSYFTRICKKLTNKADSLLRKEYVHAKEF
ncbi:Putative papain-like cysteine peptidase [Butyrivibrio hungatei DSM 14810]|uniref:Putative papain-like cysteine peptidase n=1 Tax=Butyrivibrio hungatei DSM 14810 TaxID=1121132 RepID=A0A1M7T525_9FIRM|nr:DUF1796 family putative cysteine peptidase [Butyrivibrio hungatei]SHN65797.1 Putative papain-like cysteine peptidase [Butyrivibrio hungatei DSM 14810]